jgi:hypothetical protein
VEYDEIDDNSVVDDGVVEAGNCIVKDGLYVDSCSEAYSDKDF